jgi:transposase-like protein
MASFLNAPYFSDEQAAFDQLEAIVWPDGIVCPHCGVIGNAAALNGVKDKKGRVRFGLKKCYACRKQFTVRVGTVFHASHAPLHIWFQAAFLLCSSKKGISSNQLHRTLGVTLKTAWFMARRLREAMAVFGMQPMMGGPGKPVEADETYIGNKRPKASKARGYAHKHDVVSLVERGENVRSHHVNDVNSATLRPILKAQIKADTMLMTDGSSVYRSIGKGWIAGSMATSISAIPTASRSSGSSASRVARTLRPAWCAISRAPWSARRPHWGLFLTLNEPTREMTREAATAGFYETGGMRFPKLQTYLSPTSLPVAGPSTRRSSTRGTPRGLFGSSGSITDHSKSVRSNRAIPISPDHSRED